MGADREWAMALNNVDYSGGGERRWPGGERSVAPWNLPKRVWHSEGMREIDCYDINAALASLQDAAPCCISTRGLRCFNPLVTFSPPLQDGELNSIPTNESSAHLHCFPVTHIAELRLDPNLRPSAPGSIRRRFPRRLRRAPSRQLR
jgi:hypothetical protein